MGLFTGLFFIQGAWEVGLFFHSLQVHVLGVVPASGLNCATIMW